MKRLKYEGLHNADDITEKDGAFYRDPLGCVKVSRVGVAPRHAPLFFGSSHSPFVFVTVPMVLTCFAARYAMNRFAYYMCNKCKNPYFGGQVSCNAAQEDGSAREEDLECGACSGIAVEECPRHGTEFMYELQRGVCFSSFTHCSYGPKLFFHCSWLLRTNDFILCFVARARL